MTPSTMPTLYCSGCGQRLPHGPPVTCEHCRTEHWLDPKPCASGLVVHRGRLLMVRRAHDPWRGYWDVPGGFCGTTEHPISTAKREVREETGLEIQVTGLLGMWMDDYGPSQADGQRKTTLNIYFHAQPSGEPRLDLDETEVADAAWFERGALPTEIAFPGHIPAVLRAWEEAFRSEQLMSALPDRPVE